MEHKFGETLWRASLAFLCLMIASAQGSIPAETQGRNEAHIEKQNGSTEKRKQFKFEVISVRPVKSGWEGSYTSSPLPVEWAAHPTPNGYNSRLRLGYAILVAYAPVMGHKASIYTPILNLPAGSDADWYDISARISDDDLAAWQNQTSKYELFRSAMQNLLTERFKLVIHEHPAEMPAYKLVVGKKGPKLEVTPPGFVPPPGLTLESGGILVPPGRVEVPPVLHFYAATMEDLAGFQTGFIERPVQDMTGLTGRYNFALQLNTLSDDDSKEFRWPLGALGLELKPSKYLGTTIVIDHIEKPSAN
jgi:uncharacterized protein (TIGR03435 family)